MENLQKVVLVAHTLIALLIIIMVLLQRGKGADAGAAFGSGASGTVFGARGSASFFSRTTAVLATAFFVSSLALAYLSSQTTAGPSSLLDDAPVLEQPAAGSDDEVPEPAAEPVELPSIEDDASSLPALEDDVAIPDEVPAGDDSTE